MTNHIDRIRDHVEAHKDRERATFSIEGIKALLSQIDNARSGPAARTQLVQELQWYAEKKRWPKGLAPLGNLLTQTISALSTAEPVSSVPATSTKLARLTTALTNLCEAYAACNGEDHPAYVEARTILTITGGQHHAGQ